MIRLAAPLIEDDDLAAVADVLRTGQLVQGVQVAALEAAVAAVTGSAQVVAVSSGTAALHLALIAAGVGPGDRVAVPTYSWPATANVVVAVGAEPVFVEIDDETFAMSPEHLAEKARGVLRLVLPVHPFGQLADLAALARAAPGVPVIEDAACALGAERDGVRAGAAGLLGCFSFHPRKAVTTGEGGAITTEDAQLARTLRAWRNHGLDPQAPTAQFVLPGLNYRLSEIHAALGVSQMRKLDRIVHARRAAAAAYDELLAGTPVRPPVVPPGSHPVVQSYVTMLPAGVDRAAVLDHLRSQGIETQIGTWHLPMTRYYRDRGGFAPGDFPVTDAVFARALTLPMSPGIDRSSQEHVVTQLLAAL